MRLTPSHSEYKCQGKLHKDGSWSWRVPACVPNSANIITVGAKVGPVARSGDRYTISCGEHPDLWAYPKKAAFLGFFFLGRKPENWKEKLPQSDLLVCSLQLLLHIHNCTWMLNKHGKIDKNILLKRSILFRDVA